MGDIDSEKIIYVSLRVRSLLMVATFAASAYWLYRSYCIPFSGNKKYSSPDQDDASNNSKVDNEAHKVRPEIVQGDEENISPDDHAQASEKREVQIVANKVRPAVVHISLQGGLDDDKASEKIGCGVIFDKDGFILTSAHGVAKKPKQKVIVRLANSGRFEGIEGEVIMVRKDEDIAIVKINPHSQLPIAKFGSSSRLLPKQTVIAMGSPDSFQTNFTRCTVRAISRKCHDFGPMFGRSFLVTSPSTSVENSGGPLVNMNGEVVGIHLHKVFNANQSYVLPIDRVSIAIPLMVLEWKVEQRHLELKIDGISETDSYNVKNQ